MTEAYLPYQGCGPTAKSIAKADVTLDFSTVTYDGSDHAPAVQSVSLNGKELRADQDYVYTAVRYKDAGNYNVQVMGINEYGGVKEVPWSIERAKGSIRVEPAQVTIQGAAGTTATVNIVYEGDGDITVSESQYVTSRVINIDPVFSRNNWEQIAYVCALGMVPESWKIGDTKTGTWFGETQELQIIGKNHDDLDETDEKYSDPTYNSGSKKAALTLLPVNQHSTAYRMNSTDTNTTSWKDSEMRMETIQTLDALTDPAIRAVMRTVTKCTGQSSTDATIVKTADKVFLLSHIEIFESVGSSHPGEGTQYKYFADGGSKVKTRDGYASAWWTRSPSTRYSNTFLFANSSGATGSNDAHYPWGVVAAFCI